MESFDVETKGGWLNIEPGAEPGLYHVFLVDKHGETCDNLGRFMADDIDAAMVKAESIAKAIELDKVAE